MVDKELVSIMDQVYKITGFNAHQYRPNTLRRRLERRLIATKSKNYKEYGAHLKKYPSEAHTFLNTLTINVSDFFRDKKIFHTLKTVTLPEIFNKFAAKRKKRLRIWSVGCSKGQEPYSLAMILNELIENKKTSLKIIIHATDWNKIVLTQAKRGLYEKSDLKNVPQKYQKNYFSKANKNKFRTKTNIKKMVKFKQHDLINGNSLGKFDVILCRNLFIFFTPELQDKMFLKIHNSLNKDGILVLGTAETARNKKLFRCLSSPDHIYQKIA